MSFQKELEVALSIVRRAGELALHYFAQETPPQEKDDASPVTIADHECEKLICRLLSDTFSEDGIIGEEGVRKQSHSGRRWIVDPIDGTRDFVRRTPFWSILLALEAEGQVVLGVMHFPCLKETLYASWGEGCFHNRVRVRASDITRIDKAILTVSAFKDAWNSWDPKSIRFLTEQCWTVRAYGGCHDISMLAQGKIDIWLSGGGREWDYAPARIVARECGASFLTRDGGDRIDANHCLVCAPGLERDLRDILGIPG